MEIKWEKPTSYLGRNGCFKCVGLTIAKGPKEIMIIAENTRGSARCYIEIPTTAIPELVEKLQEAYSGRTVSVFTERNAAQ